MDLVIDDVDFDVPVETRQYTWGELNTLFMNEETESISDVSSDEEFDFDDMDVAGKDDGDGVDGGGGGGSSDLFQVPGLKPEYKLFPYQQNTVMWMRDREFDGLPPNSLTTDFSRAPGGIVSLEMGLGKTIIALALGAISRDRDRNERLGPTLWVVEKSKLYDIPREIEKFFGDSISYMVFYKEELGSKMDETERDVFIQGRDLVITTYDTVRIGYQSNNIAREVVQYNARTGNVDRLERVGMRHPENADNPDSYGKEILFRTPWARIVADESQKFRNPKSKLYESMMALPGKYRWCLTGTPVMNNTYDLYSSLSFCGYEGTYRWQQWTENTYRNHKCYRMILQMNTKQAGVKLPEIIKHEVLIELQGEERQAYDHWRRGTEMVYRKFRWEGEVSFASMLTCFVRLRQMCIAGYMTTENSKETKAKQRENAQQDELEWRRIFDEMNGGLTTWIYDRFGTAGIESAKVRRTVQIVKDELKDGQKCLIFSNFRGSLDLVEFALKLNIMGIRIARIDGGVTGKRRDWEIEMFKENPNVNVFLMTYGTGSKGLNLTEANHVVFMEPWWCPQIQLQAQKRAHRIGQTDDVHVYYLVAQDTIEERILQVQEEKLRLAENLLSKSRKVSAARPDAALIGRILGMRF